MTNVAMTNLGPLTTTFTPSGTNCQSSFLGNLGSIGGPILNGWNQYGAGPDESAACLPTSFRPEGTYYYSPGICPSGYGEACKTFFTSDNVPITQATCCPSGYQCRDDTVVDRLNDPFGCISVPTKNTTVPISIYTFWINSDNATVKYNAGFTTGTWNTEAFWLASGPIVRRAAGDTFVTTTDSGTASSTTGNATPAPTTTNSPESTGTSSPEPANTASGSSGGLSSGATAGIAVGTTLGTVVLIGGIVAFMVRQRRRARRQQQQNIPDVISRSPNKPLFEPNHHGRPLELDPHRTYGEIDTYNRYSMPPVYRQTPPAELG